MPAEMRLWQHRWLFTLQDDDITILMSTKDKPCHVSLPTSSNHLAHVSLQSTMHTSTLLPRPLVKPILYQKQVMLYACALHCALSLWGH